MDFPAADNSLTRSPSPSPWRRWTIRAILAIGTVALLLDVFTMFFLFSVQDSRRLDTRYMNVAAFAFAGRVGTGWSCDDFDPNTPTPAARRSMKFRFEPVESATGRWTALTKLRWTHDQVPVSSYDSFALAGFSWTSQRDGGATGPSPGGLRLRREVVLIVPLYAVWLPAVIILLWRCRTRRRNRVAAGFPVQATPSS